MLGLRTPIAAAGRRSARRAQAHDGSGLPSEEATPAQPDAPEDLRARIKSGNVDLIDLLLLKNWQRMPGELLRTREDHEMQEFARDNLDRALQDFKRTKQGENVQVSVSACGGVFVTRSGEFRYATLASAIRFDWLEAQQLIHRVDALAERAKEWWRPDGESAGPDGSARRRERRRADRIAKTHARLTAEREPHLNLAYGLMTATYSTIVDENARHLPRGRRHPLLRAAVRLAVGIRAMLEPEHPASPAALEPDRRRPSERFSRQLSHIRTEVERGERLFEIATQRDAQLRYGKGMVLGALGVAVLCMVLGGVFISFDTPAEYGVAFPAGALGALVSVLQRMTVGKLQLDVDAGKKMLTVLGAVRPVIGGVLGMAVFALFVGGVLPAVDAASHPPLAFYGAVGFLAGFNERFAQDMLVGSARRLHSGSTRESGSSAAEDASR